jgi:hypothetical protein
MTNGPAATSPFIGADGLIALPHSGVWLPDPSVRVTSLWQIQTPNGGAFEAGLRRGEERLGSIVHLHGSYGVTWQQVGVAAAAAAAASLSVVLMAIFLGARLRGRRRWSR